MQEKPALSIQLLKLTREQVQQVQQWLNLQTTFATKDSNSPSPCCPPKAQEPSQLQAPMASGLEKFVLNEIPGLAVQCSQGLPLGVAME
ncbi:hypothetical protein P7K49_026565 [Saguinus oedipus]|uniref:Uncharacterized protein n=1 Tax=Saguinus oedipus TaxID=9490 RepID=A0ABQ9UDL1_SAGOE|nr:hypothetical protein P7K49_026565 [Saguinus oedipus]